MARPLTADELRMGTLHVLSSPEDTLKIFNDIKAAEANFTAEAFCSIGVSRDDPGDNPMKREVILSEEDYEYLMKILGTLRGQTQNFAESLRKSNEQSYNTNAALRTIVDERIEESHRLGHILERFERAKEPSDKSQENEKLREQRNVQSRVIEDMIEFIELLASDRHDLGNIVNAARRFLIDRGYVKPDRWSKRERLSQCAPPISFTDARNTKP